MPFARVLRGTAVSAIAVLLAACSDTPSTTAADAGALRRTSRAEVALLNAQAIASIRINEVESQGGAPGDWVEFHNSSNAPIDISGFFFKDNDNTRTFTLPTGSIVPANGFLVLDESINGGPGFNFGLGAPDQARLFLPDNSTLVDSYSWSTHSPTTYGRCPDGTGEFATTSIPTKGTANNCSPLIVINEIEGSGGTPGDWVELFNAGPTPADISGYIFRDNNDANSFVIPAGTIVAPGGYFLLEESISGSPGFTFGIGAPDAARLFLPNGTSLVDSYSWTTHATTSYGRCPNGSGAFVVTGGVTKGATNNCGALPTTIFFNEVESNLGTPGDWVELINTGSTPVDLSGFVFRDNNDLASYVLPAGSIVPANGYLVLDESINGSVGFPFGLGAGDAARLFAPGGTILIDSFTWTTHAQVTWGRCPNGTGPWTDANSATKGAVNDCAPPPVFGAWPGGASVMNAEAGGLVAGNLSGLFYAGSRYAKTQGPGVMWAVRNGPGALFRLLGPDNIWTSDQANGWGAGKLLRYPNGSGDVDAEGVTVVGNIAYVAAERNNANSAVSKNSILSYDLTSTASELTAIREWDLTSDLPANGANLGLEAITYIPDAFLVAQGFVDQRTGQPWTPSSVPDHGDGLFFVGVEASGDIFVYALQSNGTAVRIASFSSGFVQVMDLAFDAEAGDLWAVCDNGCNGRSTILRIGQTSGPTRGRFVVARRFERPTGLPNLNNEGFTFAPQSECVGGVKSVYWADDSNTGNISLRAGTLSCSAK
jgi:hypothetical protein